MCVSPRLPKSGSVPFSVSINDVLVENSVRFFYAQHYSDLADVTVDPRILIISSGQPLNINWLNPSLLPTADSDINVDIILHEAVVSFSKSITWIGEYVVKSNLSNDGSASIRIPSIESSSTFNEFNSSYSLIVIQIAVSTSSANSNNQYWKALKELQRTTDTHVAVGRWTHVLFRTHVRLMSRRLRIRAQTDDVLCSNWLSSNRSHFSLDFTNDLDPCPCNRLQAQLPQSGFTQRITPGKQIIDQFLFGSTTTCYESRNLIDPGDGRHIISQECCYNQQGDLLVGGPYGGSANAQPSHAWENHFVFDLSPFISCCLIESRYSEYYEKRPSDNCSRFQPFNIGWMHGDPHLLTLDGHQYTFNGSGEFILIETLNNRFTLQGCMIPAENDGGTESLGTVFSAIVAKQNDSDVIELRRSVFTRSIQQCYYNK